MRKIYETAVILIGTLSWWGFVYPELCLTEDAYEQEESAQMEDDAHKDSFWEEGIKVGELCIKSRAAEYVYQVSEKKSQKRD